MSQSAQIHESSLLGRAAELAALNQALEDAQIGRGRLALVSGEAGIGKSALVDEVQRAAQDRGFSVLTGRAWEFADAPPWFAVRNCLRSLGINPKEIESEAEEGAFVVWERVLEALAVTTRDTPALWVIEDVHAADLQTLDLLVFLVQPLRALHGLIVVTTRAEDPRLSDRMKERLTRMARDGIDLRLAPLEAPVVQELVNRIAKTQVPQSIVKQLVELSAGNPLFIVEYARALAAARGHRGALETLPPTVRQVVLERARWLPEETQTILNACSVIGRDFSAALVARVLGALPAQVIDDLIPALRAGLVLELAPGQFRFSHVLVRDAFYEAMDVSRRSTLHAEAASTFDTQSSDSLITAAQHALRGLPITDAGATLQLVDRAVEVLVAQRAHDRAFALRQQCDQARGEGTLPEATPEQLMASAGLARAAGRFKEARAICEDLLARARSQPNPELLANAALTLGASLMPGIVDRVLVGALSDAQAALADDTSKLACLVRARLAAALQPAPDPQEPIQMALAVIEDTRKHNDPELLRDVLFFAGSALVDFAAPEQRLSCSNELFELSQQTGDVPRALQATVRLAVEYSTSGDFVRFSEAVDRAFQLSDQLGHAPRYRWRPMLLASMRATAAGRFAESERLIVEVQQLAAHCDDPALNMALPGHQLLTLHTQRQDEEVEKVYPLVTAEFQNAPLGEAISAMVALTIATRVEDRKRAEAALVTVMPHIDRFIQDPDFCALVAEGVAWVGSDELKRKVRAQLVKIGSPELSMGHIVMVYMGPAKRAIALLDAALGDTERALEQLTESRDLSASRGHVPWVAQTEYDIGKVLVNAGRAAEAPPHFERAAALAEQIGMRPLAAAAKARMGVASESKQSSTPEPAAQLSLVSKGDTWQVRYGDRAFSVRDMRGMQLLARLLERPGEEIHALVLSGDEGASLTESDAGEQLDETARNAYRSRLVELEAAIDEAEAAADRGHLAKLQRERDALVSELSRAVGLGGRSRQAGSATERARVNVRKRLKQAISRISELDAAAGQYLSQAVRTGAFCSFRP